MADIKNNGGNNYNSDLKLQDSDKLNNASSRVDNDGKSNMFKSNSADVLKSVKSIKKRRVPVAVDVIVAILLLAIIVVAVFGVYYLFRYFAKDYESVDVTYVFAVTGAVPAEGDTYSDMKNDYLLYDIDGNTIGLGRIRSAEFFVENELLLLTVEVNAKYNEHEGYSVGDVVLAVGKSYPLRTEEVALCGTVVELYGKDGNN